MFDKAVPVRNKRESEYACLKIVKGEEVLKVAGPSSELFSARSTTQQTS